MAQQLIEWQGQAGHLKAFVYPAILRIAHFFIHIYIKRLLTAYCYYILKVYKEIIDALTDTSELIGRVPDC